MEKYPAESQHSRRVVAQLVMMMVMWATVTLTTQICRGATGDDGGDVSHSDTHHTNMLWRNWWWWLCEPQWHSPHKSVVAQLMMMVMWATVTLTTQICCGAEILSMSVEILRKWEWKWMTLSVTVCSLCAGIPHCVAASLTFLGKPFNFVFRLKYIYLFSYSLT
jgi:hypothetical protein